MDKAGRHQHRRQRNAGKHAGLGQRVCHCYCSMVYKTQIVTRVGQSRRKGSTLAGWRVAPGLVPSHRRRRQATSPPFISNAAAPLAYSHLVHACHERNQLYAAHAPVWTGRACVPASRVAQAVVVDSLTRREREYGTSCARCSTQKEIEAMTTLTPMDKSW